MLLAVIGDAVRSIVDGHIVLSRDLVRTAQVSAEAVRRQVASMELSLRYLADSAAHLLTLPAPPSEATVYTLEDFRQPETAPPDLQMSWRYARPTAEGAPLPSAVSTGYPVVVVPAGQRAALDPQIHRLAGLTPVFRTIYRMNAGVVYRTYIGLENGVHISFPGHAQLTGAFDPRQRPWFGEARRRGELTWLSHTDHASQNLVFTVAVPVSDAAGRFRGVAAIDMLPAEFMQMDQLRAQWSQDTRAFLVIPKALSADGNFGLEIIARGNLSDTAEHPPARSAGHAANQARESHFSFSDPAQQQTLLDAMQTEASGALALPYRNTPSIWAFARFQPPMETALWILLVVPERLVTSLSEQVGQNALDHTHRMYRITGIVAGLLLLLVLLVGWIGSRTILRPLYIMVGAWNRLSTGDFSVRLNVRAGDERDILIDAFNAIVPRLEAHWDLSQSMELARQIQRNLLPRRTPHLPGLEIAGDSRFCDATGGDYYDVFPIGSADDQRLAVVVGDVSGHGVAAALLMTTARAMIRSMSVFEADVARRITQVNRLLIPDTTDTADFITLFYLECDMTQRRLSWVRAGHDPALRYDPRRDRFTELNGEGMALGIDADYRFQACSAPMGQPGQIIVIGTDGIWEAHNPQGEMFGKARLRQVVRRHHTASAEAVREAIFQAVADFTGPGQDDDITLAVIKLL